MVRKLVAKLVANFQPRMNLGEKRFLEDREAHEEASNYNKSLNAQHERDRLRTQTEKREAPSKEEILGPSDSREV